MVEQLSIVPLDLFEHAESRAWMEIQRSVDPEFRDRFGVEVLAVDGSVVLLAPNTDMLALNRVWSPGAAPRLNEETLDRVIGLFRERDAARFVLPANQSLALARNEVGNFSFEVETKAALVT